MEKHWAADEGPGMLSDGSTIGRCFLKEVDMKSGFV
jgi:hypothetical protein